MPDLPRIRREEWLAQWDVSQTKSAIGTSYVDIYTQTNSQGKPVYIDTNGKTHYRVVAYWNKAGGAGTHQLKVCDTANPTGNILHNFSNAANGKNDSGLLVIPSGLVRSRLEYKLMALSSTGTDSPIHEGTRVWLA